MSQNEVARVAWGVAKANDGIATLHDQLGEIDRGIRESRSERAWLAVLFTVFGMLVGVSLTRQAARGGSGVRP